ncbi:MAG TPA: hypothetical protein VGX23_31885 [Actinocrinis sp.]|nr:hypothetical protein [Actinocrinis sp.]
MDGEPAESERERWYAARGWPVEADPPPGRAGREYDARHRTGGGADGAVASRVWLLTGELFDVIEVPEQAGRDAVRRLLDYGQAALRPGPVGLTGPGRCGFLVAPGAAEDLPELLEWLDWGGIELGLAAFGAGGRVPAPGPRDWLHDPSAPAPELVALLATIAQACWLDRLGRPARPAVPASRPGPGREHGRSPGRERTEGRP